MGFVAPLSVGLEAIERDFGVWRKDPVARHAARLQPGCKKGSQRLPGTCISPGNPATVSVLSGS